jgi:hypothetical protein
MQRTTSIPRSHRWTPRSMILMLVAVAVAVALLVILAPRRAGAHQLDHLTGIGSDARAGARSSARAPARWRLGSAR